MLLGYLMGDYEMKNALIQTTNKSAADTANYSLKIKQESLFPELEPKPIQPPPNTLTSRLLELFKEGRALTSPDFQNLTGSWRLAAVVFELKGLNWPILAIRISAPSPSRPNRKIAPYFMSKV